MKNRTAITAAGIITAVVVIFTIPCRAQIKAVGCGSSKGSLPCGAEWDEGDYHCICDCSTIPPAKCTKRSSSAGSSGGGGGGGYSSQTQMMQSILTPVFENFFDNVFKWLFSGPSPEQQEKKRQQQIDGIESKKRIEEYEKRWEEYKVLAQEQIKYARGEYQKQIQDAYQEKLKSTIAELKNKFAVSEATKAVKQANCAAYASLQAAESKLQGFGDFKDLDGEMEKVRKSADFTSANTNGCPPIKIEIPEVSAARPISFQQVFYGYIEHQSDSIARTIDTLKEKKAANDKVLEEKRQRVEEIKQVVEKQQQEKKPDGAINRQEDDQLTSDALKQLETASRELQTAEEADTKMKEEIEAKDKTILALEQMRKTYDTDNKQTTPQQPSTKKE